MQQWDGLVQDRPGDELIRCSKAAYAVRADFLELFRIATDIAAPGPDGARAARAAEGVLHDRFVWPRGATRWSRGSRATPIRLSCTTRSGAFMAERFRKLPGMDPIMDSALSFAASKDDPASGGRHKVWGSKPLWVLPQTSTIASHLPKALGTAVAIEQARRIGHQLPIPEDSIAICSFGDASSNHADRRRRSTPRAGPPTRSCPRRFCSSARTTASAFR